MRRSVDLDGKNLVAEHEYSYTERQETRILDSAGKVKEQHSRTTDIILLEGSPYRRVVARDGKPLAPAEQKREDDKLRFDTGERSHETPEQRKARLADWDRRQRRMHEPLSEVPDAFTFKLAGEETLDGRPVYVVDAMPKPGYKPKRQSSQYLPHVKARLWIDRDDYQWRKVDAETLDTISFAAFLVRIAKGTKIELDQNHIDGDAWVLTRLSLSGSLRVALVKVIHGTFDFHWSDFKRFPAQSQAASAGN